MIKVKCKSNLISDLAADIKKFAFGQDDNGVVDLTLGNEYQVFGFRKNKQGEFYLVLTDSIHKELPWWMPASFFESHGEDAPQSWTTKTWGVLSKDTITAPSPYFDAIDDIEDGTEKGYAAFKLIRAEAA